MGMLHKNNTEKEWIEKLSDHYDFQQRWKAEEELAAMGVAVIPSLIETLQDIDRRVSAANVLVRIGKASIDPLINCLADPDWRVRFISANALGKLKAVEAVDILINLLHDPRPEVRQYSAEALGMIGDRRALQPLKNRLQSEDSMLAIRGIEEALRYF